MAGQLKGMGTRSLNHHVKNWNMMVMMMDLGWNLFPSTRSFGCLFLFNIVVQYRCWCIVINDYHHLREGGSAWGIHQRATQFTYHKQKTSASLKVLRIHVLHIMKRPW